MLRLRGVRSTPHNLVLCQRQLMTTSAMLVQRVAAHAGQAIELPVTRPRDNQGKLASNGRQPGIAASSSRHLHKDSAVFVDHEPLGCSTHLLLNRPFCSVYECYGMYKVTGPALIVKKEVCGGVHLEAYLLEGAQVEFPEPGGPSVRITEAMLADSGEAGCGRPCCCVLAGQYVELSGAYELSDTGARTHRLPGKGSLVVSVASMTDGATIVLARDGHLSYPVNIQPVPPGTPMAT